MVPNERDVLRYIADHPGPAQRMMRAIRTAIRAAAPGAVERMSYGMPFYEYRFPGFRGRLAYFGAYQRHVSFQPLPHRIPPALERQLVPFRAAKSTLRFPMGATVPVTLIRRLVKLRRAEIDAVRV